jgi:hypothetical protein
MVTLIVTRLLSFAEVMGLVNFFPKEQRREGEQEGRASPSRSS